ncbi:MAG: PEP-CTERM sorting domain-containing protein [Phycisphaerales bacterium JB038]
MKSSLFALTASAVCCAGIQADVITGTITDWPESGPFMTVGDGNNSVTMWWSINYYDLGWFYGSSYGTGTDVAVATGITDVTQISDASIFNYTSSYVGPIGDADYNGNGIGTFLAWRNTTTGYYGVLRVDDIDYIDPDQPYAELDGTWWFQTDGSGNFVPAPSTLALLGLGALTLRRRR